MKARDLRKQSKNHGEKEACYACGKHKGITHLHHVVSLKDCAALLCNNETINVPVVWLCPNCHAYIHQMQKGIFYNAMRDLEKGTYNVLKFLEEKRFDVWRSEIMGGCQYE